MRQGLKIYACSGVGETTERLSYWTDDTNMITNTRAVNSLLADINLLDGEIAYDNLSAEEVVKRENIIDLYVVCLKAAQKYNGEELYAAGRAIQEMISTSAFSSTSLDNEERDLNLLSLIDKMYQMVANGEGSSSDSGEFYQWFVENVAEENYNGLKEEKIAAVNGIGDPQVNLDNAGAYFSYILLSDEQAKKLPLVFYKKRKIEQKVLKAVHLRYDESYSSPAKVDEIIYGGIRSYYKKDPKEVAKEIYQQANGGVGEVTAIISAIAALLNVLISALALVLQYCATKEAIKYAVPTDEEAFSGCPEAVDFGELKNGKSSNLLKWGLIGAAALFILKKLK